MKIRLFWIGMTVLGSVFAQTPALRVGDPAPRLTVQDRQGAAVELHSYRQRAIVVLAVTGGSGVPAQAARDDAWRRLEPLGAVALYLPGGARPSTYLIDKTGTVRRSLAGLAPGAREMEEFVSVWQLGQGVFESSCARCHGPDGALDICLDVKPLVGIGHRLSQTEIRERLRMAELNPDQFLIRSMFFKKAEVEAVIAYISGL